jgi:hypothetical protein
MSIFNLFNKTKKPIHINFPVKDCSQLGQHKQKRNVVKYNEPRHIVTKRDVMTKGFPADYFFEGNNKIKCKEMNILDPLPIDVYDAYYNGVQGRKSWEGSKCFAIAETEDYIFYNYGCYPDGSGGCNLRQSKKNPRKVVFFGKARTMTCVFHDHLVQVDSTSSRTELYLWTKNIHTGKEKMYSWFGKYWIEPDRSSRYTQDVILRLSVDPDRDVLIVTVSREFSDMANEKDEEYICNADTNYTLEIRYFNDDFQAVANYPELNAIQSFENLY